MPITVPTLATRFGTEYPIIGVFRTDTERFLFHNPADATTMYLPGEPILVNMDDKQIVAMVQERILPGEAHNVVRRFTADFPCILSADVSEGTAIYWDKGVATDANPVGVAKLEGDVTNGFLLGYATYIYEKGKTYDVDADDRVVCGTTASTHIRVMNLEGLSLGIGTYAPASS